MSNDGISNMLNLLPTGKGELIKISQYGIWVKMGKCTIFINFSETFTREGFLDMLKQDKANV